MKNSGILIFVAFFAVLAGVLAFFLGKNKGDDDGDGKVATQCTGANTTDECVAIAKNLKRIFTEQWNWDDSQILNNFRKIKDECGAIKVYQAFGTASTYVPWISDGGIDDFMAHANEFTRDSARQFTYGIGSF